MDPTGSVKIVKTLCGIALAWTFLVLNGTFGSDYGSPPEPPPPPPGTAEVYYSTCGGAHPPVKFVGSKLSSDDPGYEEWLKYVLSPAYRRYLDDLEKFLKNYYPDKPDEKGPAKSDDPTPPELPPAPPPQPEDSTPSEKPKFKTPERFMGHDLTKSPFQSGDSLRGGTVVARVNRNPKQDLARWFRGALYHDPNRLAVYDGKPEAAKKSGDLDSE